MVAPPSEMSVRPRHVRLAHVCETRSSRFTGCTLHPESRSALSERTRTSVVHHCARLDDLRSCRQLPGVQPCPVTRRCEASNVSISPHLHRERRARRGSHRPLEGQPRGRGRDDAHARSRRPPRGSGGTRSERAIETGDRSSRINSCGPSRSRGERELALVDAESDPAR